MKHPIPGALFCALMLTACAGSKDNQRAEIVECSGHISAVAQASFMGDNSFATRVNNALDEKVSNLGNTVARLTQGAAKYAEDLDPAKAANLADSGAALAKKHFANE